MHLTSVLPLLSSCALHCLVVLCLPSQSSSGHLPCHHVCITDLRSTHQNQMYVMAALWQLSVLVLLANVVNCQSPCIPPAETTLTVPTPGCVFTWLQYFPNQSGRTKTIYPAVVTSEYDAVDCSMCSVTNVPNVDAAAPVSPLNHAS